MLLQVAKN